MPKRKTSYEIDIEFEKLIQSPDKLYSNKTINIAGKVLSTDIYCTEYIAQKLLHTDNYMRLDKIEINTRESSYVPHAGTKPRPLTKTNRVEDQQARNWYIEKYENPDIGITVEYQVPLKNTKHDKIGKIDLIFSKNDQIFLTEFKYGNNKETALRAILEIETYFRIIDKNKFCIDINHATNNNIFYKIENINKAVLVGKNTRAYKEFQEMDLGLRPFLSKLVEGFQIKICAVD